MADEPTRSAPRGFASELDDREHPDGCPVPDLPQLALEVAHGTGHAADGDLPLRARRLHDWLVWAQNDSVASRRPRWAYLAAHGNSVTSDRDTFVLALWTRMTEKRTGPESIVAYLEKNHFPWSFYERHFSGWFRSRFDLRRARAVFPRARLAGSLHFLFAALLTAVGLGALAFKDLTLLAAAVATLAAVLGAVLLWLLSRLPLYAYLDSLIPRLGAAVGIGYLFLAAAPDLVRVVDEVRSATWRLWCVTAALVVAVFLYVCLHVRQRVFPPLRRRPLALRSLGLSVLAVGYAAAGLAVAGPLIFRRNLLYGSGPPPPAVRPLPEHLALAAAIALALGVVLQLAWEEKPLTEPL